jgi:prepilin-type N-terminal cleavage/methylation domain-containing protein
MSRFQKLFKKATKAFTLIEILIVIAIIGILTVALLPRIQGAQASARNTARKADLNQIATALAAYNGDFGKYPSKLEDLTSNSYLNALPKDPASKTICGSAGYAYKPEGDGYILAAYMEKQAGNPNVNFIGDCPTESNGGQACEKGSCSATDASKLRYVIRTQN